MRAVSIILPVFAESGAILTFHQELTRFLSGIDHLYLFTLIYVVDPAGDDTEAHLRKLAKGDPRVSVLIMSRRFGHQAALLAGIDHADGDAIIMMDSDGQHPVELISRMISEWEGGADIVQTLRRDGMVNTSFNRLMSRSFYNLLKRVAKLPMASGAADFRLISRRVADVFRTELRERRIFLRGMIAWVGYRIVFISYQPKRRLAGQTKYRLSTLIDLGIMGFVNFTALPLRGMVVGGIALSLLSVLGLLVLLILFLAGIGREVPGWLSIMFGLGMTAGANFLFLGILGEYVAQILDEVKGRPRYIVAEKHGASLKRQP